ncbi:MAG TPA: hypothetical protein VNL73_04510 [Verrucomicrobiae bacterium]|nr:hypothetical protein [Verrucomicrobiae bacterium]
MKKLTPALPIGALLSCLFWINLASAQTPDPRDSVIIESKTVNPGAGKPAARIKVLITNKDTLTNVNLGLIEKSLTGGAYMILARPRTYDSVVTKLTSTLPFYKYFKGTGYNDVSPDTFVISSFVDPNDPATFEPPNTVRKALLEIKFDTIRSAIGTLALDSLKSFGGNRVQFVSMVNESFYDVPVNFVKGIITVEAPPPPPPPCLDANGDGEFTTVDIVTALNCVFLGEGDCGPISTPADIVALLYFLFSDAPQPQIPPVCD